MIINDVITNDVAINDVTINDVITNDVIAERFVKSFGSPSSALLHSPQ